MQTIISLLRGINVGGNKKIKMDALRKVYTSLGLHDTKTLLQSGNAIFQTDTSDLAQLKTILKQGIESHFGFDVQVILRTPDELKAILANHPFTDEQLTEPSKISIVYLDRVPSDEVIADLINSHQGREIIHSAGQELYIFYTDGKGKSKLDNARIERKLNAVATARNWNTSTKLLKLASE